MSGDYSVQRLRGGYAIVWRDGAGKRHRKQLDATTRPGAEAEARREWAGAQVNGADWSVGGIMTAYLADRKAEGIATHQRQADAWKAMQGFWAGIQPAQIDRAMAQDYAARRKVAPATVRYELSMLAVSLRWAKERGYLRDAPPVWRPAPPERQTRHLTHSQFEKFFAAVRAPHARLYVLLGLYTLARPTAILELEWDRIDLDKGMIDLNPRGRTQTRKRRPVVPLHEELKAELATAFAARQTEYVVERGAKQIASMKKAFQAASTRSGLHVTPYTLRHTGAVWAAEAGASMSELAQLMGHDDSATTEKHYARFSPTYLRGVVGKVQRKVQ